MTFYTWKKKYGDLHLAATNSSTTLCGMPIVGYNYAVLAGKNEKICDKCEKLKKDGKLLRNSRLD